MQAALQRHAGCIAAPGATSCRVLCHTGCIHLCLFASDSCHAGAAYLLGLDDSDGSNSLSVARSTDGGASWNRSGAVLPAPAGCRWATGAAGDASSGCCMQLMLHTVAPCHTVLHNGMPCHALHTSSTCLGLATCLPIYPPAALAVCSHPPAPCNLSAHLPTCSAGRLLPRPAGSVPVLLHQGTLFRGMELVCGPTLRWPQSFQVRSSFQLHLGRPPCHCCLLPAAGVFMGRCTCAAACSSSKPACQAARLPWH